MRHIPKMLSLVCFIMNKHCISAKVGYPHSNTKEKEVHSFNPVSNHKLGNTRAATQLTSFSFVTYICLGFIDIH